MARLNSNFVGTVMDAADGILPFGCIWPDGKTIGNAASTGTNRANNDVKMLFIKLWNNFSNTELPVSGGRGGSALADWNANKTIQVPDLRGRILVGKDNMGGISANRITSALSGIDGDILGVSGGAEAHTLSTAELATHSHGISDPGHRHTGGVPTLSGIGHFGVQIIASSKNSMSDGSALTNAFPYDSTESTGITAQNTGSGTAHNNTQPSYVLNKVMVYR